MPSKKKFIDKKQARHYQVVHRSQRDPLIVNVDASPYVLKPLPLSGNLRRLANKDPGAVADPYSVDPALREFIDLEDYSSGSGDDQSHSNDSESDDGPLEGQFDDAESDQEPVDSLKTALHGKLRLNEKNGTLNYPQEYDYNQHLKEMGAPGAVYVAAKQRESTSKGRTDIIFQNTLSDQMDIPSEALPSHQELDVGLLNQLSQPAGLALDLPDDVREVLYALDDDAYVDNDLDDDYFAEMGGVQSVQSTDQNDTTLDDSEEDSEHDYQDIKKSKSHGNAKSRLTSYSMTSSILPRTEQLQLLDSRFDALLAKEYDSENEEENHMPSTTEFGDNIEQREYFESMLDEFLTKHSVNSHAKLMENLEVQGGGAGQYDLMRRMLRTDEDGTPVKTDLRPYRYDEMTLPTSVEEEQYQAMNYQEVVSEDALSHLGLLPEKRKEERIMERVIVGMGKEENRWDCETVISTYSNLDNHPQMIRERDLATRRTQLSLINEQEEVENVDEIPKIVLSGKTGMPIGMLNSFKKESKQTNFEEDEIRDNLGAPRPRNESTEEKRERKRVLKDERRLRKMEKKVIKIAFKNEAFKQTREAMQRETFNGVRIE